MGKDFSHLILQRSYKQNSVTVEDRFKFIKAYSQKMSTAKKLKMNLALGKVGE